ncbi:hypothetical protein [Persephonella sp. KM09-Lau-8]|uniref:hypothetical protein n=1 Tax=Persephonella sp. KM09-Lau-8 TaxID=1158345 RepID=UPI00068922C4|nr:hypothetical protein [Persephonella sp. KM09-Lau-8]
MEQVIKFLIHLNTIFGFLSTFLIKKNKKKGSKSNKMTKTKFGSKDRVIKPTSNIKKDKIKDKIYEKKSKCITLLR